MSNRIDATFASLKQTGRKGLVAFCTANFPNPQDCARLLEHMPKAGVDIIELGMPFSDPIADGPTIQHSNRVALATHHTKLADIFALVRGLRTTNQATPLVLMGYYNPILQYGEQQFLDACVSAGVDGLILVDLPPEESGHFHPLARAANIAVIRLITPTTRAERMQRILAGVTSGFSYYVAVTGVTGVKKASQDDVATHLARLRQASDMPIAVGFGISTPEEARAMSRGGDAIVVGSALIRQLDKGVDQGLEFLRELRKGLDG